MDTAAWNPAQYLLFGDARLRPGFELLARVGELPLGPLYELGCGTGAHARAIAERWPDRRVVAIDHSPAMLAEARATPAPANLAWDEADIDSWTASSAPAALIFSNAALHWLPHPRRLFGRLMRELAASGVLAVQMPNNFDAPSHRLIRDLALMPRYRTKLASLTEPGGVLRDDLVQAPDFYYDVLAPLATGGVDLWRIEYLMALGGERPVLEWLKGSILRPVLERLDPAERGPFEDALAARLAEAYPRRDDGITLLPFRRLFFVARR